MCMTKERDKSFVILLIYYASKSIKYIQPILKTFNNNNSTSETNKSQKIQNRKLRKKIIPTNSYEYQHQKTTSPSINQYSTN